MYQCQCGQIHDSAVQGPCPVTVTLTMPRPVLPAGTIQLSMPVPGPAIVEPALPWKRSWYCPQCDPHKLRSMQFADWHDHLAAHTVAELREASVYASQYRYALEQILHAVEDLPGAGFVPEAVYHKVIYEARHALEWKDNQTP